ncbi:hypothetical protein HY632_04675 [Candidatus Uhrbacteria bacterium]|nr:hypothetical protein [Candidatus Uhrbacteria bacterium]
MPTFEFIPTALLDPVDDADGDRAKVEALTSFISYHRCIEELRRSRLPRMQRMVRAFLRSPVRSVCAACWSMYAWFVTITIGDGLLDHVWSMERVTEELREHVVAGWLVMLERAIAQGKAQISISLFPEPIMNAAEVITSGTLHGMLDTHAATALFGELAARVRIALGCAPNRVIYLPRGVTLALAGDGDGGVHLERRCATPVWRVV